MQVLKEEWKESRCPGLPLELWERIVAQITEPQYHPRTWLSTRRVSHLLKAATESVFARENLPQIRVEFKPLVLRQASLARYPEVVEIRLPFDRLSDDGTRAIFASKKGFDHLKDMPIPRSYAHGANETVYNVFLNHWLEMVRPYIQQSPSVKDVCFPSHCLVLDRDVNDTQLPGFEFDVEHATISVLWKPMLSNFYGEVEYEKWASKVMQQHSKRRGKEVADDAMSVRRACEQGDQRQTQVLFSTVLERMKKEENEKTCKIRMMRFKRMLEKTEYREKGEDISEDFFKMAGRASFVESVAYALCWDEDLEEINHLDERGRGCFYDGMGMTFDGKGELNEPGMNFDDDDEWEDEEDFGDNTDLHF